MGGSAPEHPFFQELSVPRLQDFRGLEPTRVLNPPMLLSRNTTGLLIRDPLTWGFDKAHANAKKMPKHILEQNICPNKRVTHRKQWTRQLSSWTHKLPLPDNLPSEFASQQ